MSVDFRKDAHILAVHGVQLGEDESITSEEQVRKLLTKSLLRSHLERDFDVFGYFYEDFNDQAQKYYKAIASAVSKGIPLAGFGLESGDRYCWGCGYGRQEYEYCQKNPEQTKETNFEIVQGWSSTRGHVP